MPFDSQPIAHCCRVAYRGPIVTRQSETLFHGRTTATPPPTSAKLDALFLGPMPNNLHLVHAAAASRISTHIAAPHHFNSRRNRNGRVMLFAPRALQSAQ